jgi:hypothetical protein
VNNICLHTGDTIYLGTGISSINEYDLGAPHLCLMCDEIVICHPRAYDSAPVLLEYDVEDVPLVIAHLTGREIPYKESAK